MEKGAAPPRWRRVAAVVVILGLYLGALGPAGAQVAAPGSFGPDDLTIESERQLTGRLSEFTVASPAAENGRTEVRILLPDGFDPSGTTRYPVLYLLHGGGEGAAAWTELGDAEAITAGVPLIVVMPGVTGYGNYVDWYNHGRGGPPMWETFVIDQLVPWIDATLPTIGDRHGRAVAGLSMGGGGALGYAARHPDRFGAAAAFSGAVDTNTVPVQALVMTSGVEAGHEIGAVHGLRLTNEVRWRGHNPWDLAENLHATELFLTTGNGLPGGPGGDIVDPVELVVHEMMTNVHNRLTNLEIDHHWDDYGPGGHTWWYWQRALTQFLPTLMATFDHRVAPPDTFHYKTIEPAFEIYGWEVSVDRPAAEFARIEGAGPQGFTVRGSGDFAVTSAPYYEPGQELRVRLETTDGVVERIVAADEAGRLRTQVSPGPGNPHQQYTLEAIAWAVLTQPGGTWPVSTASVIITPREEEERLEDDAEAELTAATAEPERPEPVLGPAPVTGAAVTQARPSQSLPTTGAASAGVAWLALALLGLVSRHLYRRVTSACRC